jgi:hypothetical protein
MIGKSDMIWEAFMKMNNDELLDLIYALADIDENVDLYDKLVQIERATPVQNHSEGFSSAMEKLHEAVQKYN